jgi:hypothetical protein
MQLTSSILEMNLKSSGLPFFQTRRSFWDSANVTGSGRLSIQTGKGGSVSDANATPRINE